MRRTASSVSSCQLGQVTSASGSIVLPRPDLAGRRQEPWWHPRPVACCSWPQSAPSAGLGSRHWLVMVRLGTGRADGRSTLSRDLSSRSGISAGRLGRDPQDPPSQCARGRVVQRYGGGEGAEAGASRPAAPGAGAGAGRPGRQLPPRAGSPFLSDGLRLRLVSAVGCAAGSGPRWRSGRLRR